MRLASTIAFASAIAHNVEALTASPLAEQTVRLVVVAPDGTTDDAIYLAGSLPALGNWRPDGVRLERQTDGTYAADVTLRLGARFDFKLSRRGHWSSVEKMFDGSERANRSAAVEATTVRIDLSVERWAE